MVKRGWVKPEQAQNAQLGLTIWQLFKFTYNLSSEVDVRKHVSTFCSAVRTVLPPAFLVGVSNSTTMLPSHLLLWENTWKRWRKEGREGGKEGKRKWRKEGREGGCVLPPSFKRSIIMVQYCGGLKENGPHRLIEICTVRRCGLIGIGVPLLMEVHR